MGKPLVDLEDDELVLRLLGGDALVALTREIVIPYGTIRRAEVAAPAWPPLTRVWGAGLRAPPLAMKGRVGKPFGPWDVFYWQDRSTRQVLRLFLEGHPRFREVHVDVEDAPKLLAALAARGIRG